KKVWVNGAFDVLHIGHIKLLEYAKSLGSVRVGLDTDTRIKMLKGEK
ncbi:MAG: D-glycero-beta-D-manno-heptose 1-phosphate adenylyltransferase, partial [Actinobacteria bacterium]|nr:D-glycero-beta-D-manno-heptose 1-phosphate adenylyltransferase [Actinomycetota bacterium]